MKKTNPEKKSIQRKCVGCGKIFNRSELIKIVKNYSDCEIILMPSTKFFGRSAYLCYNKDCLKEALRKKRLNKALKREIPAELTEKLEKMVK